MNVYDMKADGGGKWVWFFTKDKLVIPLDSVDEAAFFETHKRIAVRRNTDNVEKGSKQALADCSNVSYSGHPVFSERSKQVFAPYLEGLGEWIALDFDEAPYWLFWITNVVDALDESNSTVLRFSDDPNRVMRIAQYAFKPDIVGKQFLFTLPQRPGSNRLVTDTVVDLVRKHQLTGFMFERLWSSETGSTPSNLKDWEKPRITGLETV
jgi:hypothetical protein